MPMLMFDSLFTPLSRPATIEPTATEVSRAMMTTFGRTVSGSPTSSVSPALICEVPNPIDTASPNRVPRMAKMSMVLPIGP